MEITKHPRVLDEHEVQVLLTNLCVKLGFCLPDEAALIQSPPTDVKSFTDAVIALEGLDPETYDRRIYRAVRDMVRAAFERQGDGDV